MRRTHFDRVERLAAVSRAWLLPSWTVVMLGLAAPLSAQGPSVEVDVTQDTTVVAAGDSLVGAAVSVGDETASLELSLSDGRTVQFELRDERVYADGESLGEYDRGDALDDSWRELLEEAAMVSTDDLPAVLSRWRSPEDAGAAGDRLEERLRDALQGVGGRVGVATIGSRSERDSIDLLNERLRELEEEEAHWAAEARDEDGWDAPESIENFLSGLAELFATLIWWAIALGIGAALIFFGGGRIERVAQTVREEPLRAGLIGLAGAFLSIPFYILVTLALAISILGIPLILAWAPLFPLLFVLAGITGWMAVAYAAGDSIVRRKLTGRGMFKEPGAVHAMAVGIALLLAPFALAAVFQMTTFLEWLGHLLLVIGILTNVLMCAIGFGAVLMRGREGLDRHRERRAAEKRARAAAVDVTTVTPESTNV